MLTRLKDAEVTGSDGKDGEAKLDPGLLWRGALPVAQDLHCMGMGSETTRSTVGDENF